MPSYAVTGTSRGLGLGFIKALAADTNNIVFALTRSKSSSKDLVEFAAQNKNVHVVEGHPDDAKSLENGAKEVAKITGGTLDVLINNAALMWHERSHTTLDAFPSPDILDVDLTSFFKTNVLGVIHTINAFLPLLKAGATKKCIVISSPLGTEKMTLDANLAAFAGYSISKAALNLTTAKYTARFREEGLIFVSFNPGFVKTMQGTEEEINKFYDNQVAFLRKFYPDYEGAITIADSVRDQLSLISRVTLKDSGAFLNRDGTVAGDTP
ncbi:NAD-binding protein [Schizopora paradoxa]|uniref:NAD-binding protein n=1 Tax=Schizopora paradoxa TaxID=27342 RepID=A0A0H2RKE7_9AGAM|nr:NAD-binding protein [Schizopora paradoxa]